MGLSCSSKPVTTWCVHLNWQWAETYTSPVSVPPTVMRRSMIVLFWSDLQPVALNHTDFCVVFFSLHLAWSTIKLWSPNFSLGLLLTLDEINCGIPTQYKSHLMQTWFMMFHKIGLHVSSYLHTSQAVVTAGSHMCLKRWSVFSCYSGVLGGSHCYFKETPAGLTTGWQHLLTVICSHAGCENGSTCSKITHYC